MTLESDPFPGIGMPRRTSSERRSDMWAGFPSSSRILSAPRSIGCREGLTEDPFVDVGVCATLVAPEGGPTWSIVATGSHPEVDGSLLGTSVSSAKSVLSAASRRRSAAISERSRSTSALLVRTRSDTSASHALTTFSSTVVASYTDRIYIA